MIYFAYREDLSLSGYFIEGQESLITNYVKISDDVYARLLELEHDGVIFLKEIPQTTDIIEDINLFEARQMSLPPMIVDDKPTQVEIDFAEYVLQTEDRLALIESRLGGN